MGAVREFVNKSAASAASPDHVKFQAVIKSAASAASLDPRKNTNNPRKNCEKMKENFFSGPSVDWFEIGVWNEKIL